MTDYTTLTRTELHVLIEQRTNYLYDLQGVDLYNASYKRPRSKADCISYLESIEYLIEDVWNQIEANKQRCTSQPSTQPISPVKPDVQVSLAQRETRAAHKDAKTDLFRLLLMASLTKILVYEIAFNIAWYEQELSVVCQEFVESKSAWAALYKTFKQGLTRQEKQLTLNVFVKCDTDFRRLITKPEALTLLEQFNQLNKCFEPVAYPAKGRLESYRLVTNNGIREWVDGELQIIERHFAIGEHFNDSVIRAKEYCSHLREVITARAMALC